MSIRRWAIPAACRGYRLGAGAAQCSQAEQGFLRPFRYCEAYAYLASDAARKITGTLLSIYGGQLAL